MFKLPCARITHAVDSRVITVVYERYAVSICKQEKCVLLLLASAVKTDSDLFHHFRQVTKTQKEFDMSYDVYSLSQDTLDWCEKYLFCNPYKLELLVQADSPPPEIDFTWMVPYEVLSDINNVGSPANKAFMCACYYL